MRSTTFFSVLAAIVLLPITSGIPTTKLLAQKSLSWTVQYTYLDSAAPKQDVVTIQKQDYDAILENLHYLDLHISNAIPLARSLGDNYERDRPRLVNATQRINSRFSQGLKALPGSDKLSKDQSIEVATSYTTVQQILRDFATIVMDDLLYFGGAKTDVPERAQMHDVMVSIRDTLDPYTSSLLGVLDMSSDNRDEVIHWQNEAIAQLNKTIAGYAVTGSVRSLGGAQLSGLEA